MTDLIKKRRIFLIPLIVYLLMGAWLLPYYRYQINPDGIAQISISKYLQQGSFMLAVNGVWGILPSLYLVPFLIFIKDQLLAAHTGQVVLGGLTLAIVYILNKELLKDGKLTFITTAFAVPLVLFFSLTLITADLIYLTFLIGYIFVLTKYGYPMSIKVATLLGVLGGILYLSKEHGFYFFIAHFGSFTLYSFLAANQPTKKNVLKMFFVSSLVFLLICSIWVIFLQKKYRKIFIGSRSSYNLSWMAPNSKGFPIFTEGLFPPPHELAISSWEDPTYYPTISWYPFRSRKDFVYELGVIVKNIPELIETANQLSKLILPIIIAGGLYSILNFKKRIKSEKRFLILYYTIILLLFSLLFTHLVGGARYLWSIYLFSLLLNVYLMKVFFTKRLSLGKKVSSLLIILSCFVFVKPTAFYLYRAKNLYLGRNFLMQGKILANARISNTRLASDSNFNESMYVSYFSGNKYYGQTYRYIRNKRVNQSYQEIIDQLRKYNINYYIVWKADENIELSKIFNEIKLNGISFKLYEIN